MKNSPDHDTTRIPGLVEGEWARQAIVPVASEMPIEQLANQYSALIDGRSVIKRSIANNRPPRSVFGIALDVMKAVQAEKDAAFNKAAEQEKSDNLEALLLMNALNDCNQAFIDDHLNRLKKSGIWAMFEAIQSDLRVHGFNDVYLEARIPLVTELKPPSPSLQLGWNIRKQQEYWRFNLLDGGFDGDKFTLWQDLEHKRGVHMKTNNSSPVEDATSLIQLAFKNHYSYFTGRISTERFEHSNRFSPPVKQLPRILYNSLFTI